MVEVCFDLLLFEVKTCFFCPSLRCLKPYRLGCYIFSVAMEGLCCLFMPLLRSFPLLVPFAVLYGYFDGAYVALIPVVTSDLVGTQYLSSALGVVYFLHAIPYLVSPPIGGKVSKQSTWSNEGSNGDEGKSVKSKRAVRMVYKALVEKLVMFQNTKKDDYLKKIIQQLSIVSEVQCTLDKNCQSVWGSTPVLSKLSPQQTVCISGSWRFRHTSLQSILCKR